MYACVCGGGGGGGGTDRRHYAYIGPIRAVRAVSPTCQVGLEIRRRANAKATYTREARARESREEGETRRRANAKAMREA